MNKIICPKCGSEMEVIARITGYLAPLNRFGEGKVKELKARKNHGV